MRLIGAELPSGSFAVDRGFTVQEIETVLDDIWDVLYGARARRPGRGLLEVEGRHGHYMLDRDLLTDDLDITIFRGKTPPDPELVSPGFWFLGVPRPTEDPADRLPLHLDEIEDLRRRATALRERANELSEDAEEPRAVQVDGLRSRRRIDDAVQRMMEVEAQRVDRELRFDDLVGECLDLLGTEPEQARRSGDPARLLELARNFEKLERSERTAATILRWRRLYPALAAAALASGGLCTAGLLLEQTAWILGGALGVSGAVLPAALSEWVGRQRFGRVKAVRRELESAAEEILFKARLPELEDSIDSRTLEEASKLVARRDVLRGVKDRLEAIRITGQRRGSKERRARVLVEGMPADLEQELTSHWEREPLMAMPGLLRQMDRSAREEVRRGLLEERVEGSREGAMDALLHEASELEIEADRLQRMDAAIGFIQELAAAERSLPNALQSFLRSIVEPDTEREITSSIPARATQVTAASAEASPEETRTPVTRSATLETELAWPELEAELARLEAGLEATEMRIGSTTTASLEQPATPVESTTALDRIDAWLESRSESPLEGATDTPGAIVQELAREHVEATPPAPVLEDNQETVSAAIPAVAAPTFEMVDLRIAPIERRALAPIGDAVEKPRSIPARIAAAITSFAGGEAPAYPALHRSELPIIEADAPAAAPLPVAARTQQVEQEEGIASTPVPVPTPRQAPAPQQPDMRAITADRRLEGVEAATGAGQPLETSETSRPRTSAAPSAPKELTFEAEASATAPLAEAEVEDGRGSLWSTGLSLLSRILPQGRTTDSEQPQAALPAAAPEQASAPAMQASPPATEPTPQAPASSGRIGITEASQQAPAPAPTAEPTREVADILDDLLPEIDLAAAPAREVLEFAEFDARGPIAPEVPEVRTTEETDSVIRRYESAADAPGGTGPRVASLTREELPGTGDAQALRDGDRVREASKALEEWRRERVRALSRDL